MNVSPTQPAETAGKGAPRGSAWSWRMVPALAFFLAGAAISAAWFCRASWHRADTQPPAIVLSGATKAVLQQLDAPVEIRFYSMLDPSSVPAATQAFAGRVDQLLSQYEQDGGGRVRVARSKSFSNPSAHAAEADGINAFNNDKGASCFLGIAVVCDGQKQSLPQLAPEWEQALEPDVTRAIARALQSRPILQPPVRVEAVALDAVRKAIPDLGTVSLEAGTQMLREAALLRFQKAAEETQSRVNEAQQRLLQAQGEPSGAGQQAAEEELRKVQAEGARKMQQIAHDSSTEIAALQQLKKTAP